MRGPGKKGFVVLVGLLATTWVSVAWESTQAAIPVDDIEALSEGVNLPDLVRLAAERNPEIRAARAEWRAAIEELPQATALPDPMVQFDYFGENVETRVGPQEYRTGISQSFPFPGTLRGAGNVAAKEVQIRHAQYDRVLRDTIVDLKISYHELLYLRGAMTIAQQNQDLLNHVLKLTNVRFAEGNAKLNDVLKAQSQLAQLSYDLVLLRELDEVEQAAIAAILGLPGGARIGEAHTPERAVLNLQLEQLEVTAVAQRQEVQIAAGIAEKRREAIALARLMNLPRFTLSASRIATGNADMAVDDSGKDPWLVGVGVSVPIWLGRNRSRVRQAEMLHEAAVQRQHAVENQTRSSVKSVYFRLENARRLIELYEKSLIPQAAAAMEISEQWNDGDVKDISGFLETQGVWLNFNLARLRAVTDYQQYVARLERLVGGPLPVTETTTKREAVE